MDYLKVSGGIFLDSACHNIDLMCHILGELPVKVYVAGSRFHPETKAALVDDFDTIGVTLHFPSGTLGHMEVVRHSPFGYDDRMEIFGADGMIVVNAESPNQNRVWNADGIHACPTFNANIARLMGSYRGELEHFAACVVNGEKRASVTAETTMAVIKVCLACNESGKSGQPALIEWTPQEIPDGYVMKSLKFVKD